MKVYGLWKGGAHYAEPSVHACEEFATSMRAVQVFGNRAQGAGDGASIVAPECEMRLYRRPPQAGDRPFRVLTRGPKGGVRG